MLYITKMIQYNMNSIHIEIHQGIYLLRVTTEENFSDWDVD